MDDTPVIAESIDDFFAVCSLAYTQNVRVCDSAFDADLYSSDNARRDVPPS